MRVIDGTSGLSPPTTLIPRTTVKFAGQAEQKNDDPIAAPGQLGAALEASDFDFIPAVRIAKTEEVREPSAS
jgi:hypothetical protein